MIKHICLGLLGLILWAGIAEAQTATLLPNGEQQFVDSNGQPLAGGFVYFYSPNTTTPKTTWQDPFQATINTNPIVLNAAGRAIIYGSGSYRQVLQDQYGQTIWDQQTQDIISLITTGSLAAVECCLPAGSISSAALASTAVTPGSYTNTNLTVNAEGQITAASNGSASYVGASVNLSGSSPGSVKTAAWNANELTVETAFGGTTYKGANLNTSQLAFNGSTIGAGGMDTGALASNNSVYIYAIYNPTSNLWSTLGFVPAVITSPAPAIYIGSFMPSGYTASALISELSTDGSSNLIRFLQQGRQINIPKFNVLTITSSVPVSFTVNTAATAVPFGALTVSGVVGSPTVSTVSAGALASDINGTGQYNWFSASSTANIDGIYGGVPFYGLQVPYVATNLSISFYYKASGTSVPVRVDLNGYTF